MAGIISQVQGLFGGGKLAVPAGSPDFSILKLTHAKLGTVELKDFEIPESLPLGGTQKVIVNQYMGYNRREVQVLGPQPKVISWKAAFVFENALDRCLYVDRMRETGDPLEFVWGSIQRTVVIEEFFWTVNSKFHIPYEITFQVVKLPDNRQKDYKLKPYVAESFDLTKIVDLVVTALTTLKRVLAIVNALQKGDINSIIGAAENAFGILQSVNNNIGFLSSDQLTSTLTSLQIGILGTKNFIDNVVDSNSGDLPLGEMFEINSGLTILKEAIEKYSSTPRSNTLVMGTNLFALAQKHYGTLDAWETIAQANGLTSAMLAAPQVIKLPPYNGKQPTAEDNGLVYDSIIKPIPGYGQVGNG